jgi:hypothetical protein
MPEATWTPAQIEFLLTQLRDVVSAKVIVDNNNAIKEIHALMSGARNPKQLVRDIESSLQAKYGLAVDHKAISIAQFGPGASAIERLKWIDVALSQEGRKAKAAVKLARHGHEFVGSADGQRSTYNTLRLVASATIRAVEEACGLEDRFALQDVATEVIIGGQRIAVVLISMVTDKGEQLLTGSALVQQSDVSRAVALASLDAINRRVQWLPSETLGDSEDSGTC